jgi:hypothetical protein
LWVVIGSEGLKMKFGWTLDLTENFCRGKFDMLKCWNYLWTPFAITFVVRRKRSKPTQASGSYGWYPYYFQVSIVLKYGKPYGPSWPVEGLLIFLYVLYWIFFRIL